MVTNLTISPIDGDTVLYLQDGSSTTVKSGTTQSVQLIERGFCTVSDAGPDTDGSEHPPETQYPPQWFVDAMQKFADLMRAAMTGNTIEQPPVATPHEEGDVLTCHFYNPQQPGDLLHIDLDAPPQPTDSVVIAGVIYNVTSRTYDFNEEPPVLRIAVEHRV